MIEAWLTAFLMTQAIEAPLYTWALKDKGPLKAILIALGASAVTHPFVWFFFPAIFPEEPVAAVIARLAVSEIFAVVVEWLYLRAFGLKKAFWWAMGVNAVSFGVGVTLSLLFGWFG